MWRYYELCTDVSTDGIEQMKQLVGQGRLHPKKAKEGLATRIISDFHDEAAARLAREEFERVHVSKGVPDEIPEHRHVVEADKVFLPQLLMSAGLASSKTEANRLLRQGAVRIDDEPVAPGKFEIPARAGEQRLIKVGKRRFVRVTFE